MSADKIQYVKEFTLRLTENEAQELEKLLPKFGNSNTRVMRYVLCQHRSLERELGSYKMELAKAQEELSRLKTSLKSYFQLEQNIKGML